MAHKQPVGVELHRHLHLLGAEEVLHGLLHLLALLAGVASAPNEDPAQRVLLPPDCDQGAHFQVSKGVESSNLSSLGPSSHVAKIWTQQALDGEVLQVPVPRRVKDHGQGLVWGLDVADLYLILQPPIIVALFLGGDGQLALGFLGQSQSSY
ncbi:hypothetical protein VULLAG_LOCUS11504 [Vulpes lagopus]